MTINEMPKRYPAVIMLGKDYPDLKNVQVVIGERDCDVTVGVKAIRRVFDKNEAGNLTVHEEQVGDYCAVGKGATVGEFFDALKEVAGAVAIMAANGVNIDKGEQA